MALPSCVYRKASARRQPAVGEGQEPACRLSLLGRFGLWGSLLWTSSPHPLCHCTPHALLLNRQGGGWDAEGRRELVEWQHSMHRCGLKPTSTRPSLSYKWF